jgi:anti-anti-sigma factor
MIEIQTRADSSVICRPLGALDLAAAAHLRPLIAEVLQPRLDLTFHLSGVDYVDAFGASAFMGSLRGVQAVRGRSRGVQCEPTHRVTP